MYCIYVAIGQKPLVLEWLKPLKKKEHYVYSHSGPNASDPAPMQVYAPFAGRIWRVFRDTGRPALIFMMTYQSKLSHIEKFHFF